MAEGNYINVKSGRKDNRVVLFERDARHPLVGDMHECYIAGPGVFQVGETETVRSLLISRHLLMADDPAAEAVSDLPSDQDVNAENGQPNAADKTELVSEPQAPGRRGAGK